MAACLADLEAFEQAKCRYMAGGGAGKLARREEVALLVRTSACSSWLPGCCHKQPSCDSRTKRRVLKRVGEAVEVLQGASSLPEGEEIVMFTASDLINLDRERREEVDLLIFSILGGAEPKPRPLTDQPE